MKKSLITFVAIIFINASVLMGCSDSGSINSTKNFTVSIWDGKTVDTSWYSAIESELCIESAEQFAGFAKLANAGNSFSGLNIKLCANIDLGGYQWTPITQFDGSFDGNSCTISNFIINNAQLSKLGVFAQNNGIIKTTKS